MWLHAMGIEPDTEELPIPQDNDEEEDPFEGTEFDSDPDVGIADEGETGNEIGPQQYTSCQENTNNE